MATLPERIAKFYSAINDGPAVLAEVDALYAPRATYVDPIQSVRDREGIRRSFEKMFAKYKVTISDVYVTGDERLAMATWIMVLEPKIGPKFRIHGASDFLAEDGMVVRQRDYWDLLGTAMASLPWLDPIYRRIVNFLFI